MSQVRFNYGEIKRKHLDEAVATQLYLNIFAIAGPILPYFKIFPEKVEIWICM